MTLILCLLCFVLGVSVTAMAYKIKEGLEEEPEIKRHSINMDER